MKIMKANRIAPDGTPRFAASHLGLFCLPMSHKKDARLIWVNKRKLNESISSFFDSILINKSYYRFLSLIFLYQILFDENKTV